MEKIFCPRCHTEVRVSDYFCFNCGQNLKPAPPSTSASRQMVIYLESFFLPPYGIILGLRYLKQNDSRSKIVGVLAIALTTLSLLLFVQFIISITNSVNNAMNSQLQGF